MKLSCTFCAFRQKIVKTFEGKIQTVKMLFLLFLAFQPPQSLLSANFPFEFSLFHCRQVVVWKPQQASAITCFYWKTN